MSHKETSKNEQRDKRAVSCFKVSQETFKCEKSSVSEVSEDCMSTAKAEVSTYFKPEEPAFAYPMSQSALVFERSLSSFYNPSNQEAEKGGKVFFDLERFREMMQMAKLKDCKNKENTDTSLDYKNSAIVSDTDRNKVELRKLMASPRTRQYKAFSPRIKEMPRINESYVTMNVSELSHETEAFLITGESKTRRFGAPTALVPVSDESQKDDYNDDDEKTNTIQSNEEPSSNGLITEFANFLNNNNPKVLCLNCEGYIPLEFIDAHSLNCLGWQRLLNYRR